MKRLLFLLSLVILFSGCNNDGTFTVKGTIKGENKKRSVYINRLEINTPVLIDSAKINKKGQFSFRVKSSETDFYQLGFSTSDFITLLAEPGEKIDIQFEGKTLFEKYTVKGSPGTEKLQYLDITLERSRKQLDSLSQVYKEAQGKPGFDLAGPELESQYNEVVKAQRIKTINFIISNTTSLASIKAVYQKISPEAYVLYDPKDLQFLKIVTDSLKLAYPNSKHVQALERDFEKELGQMYASRLEKLTKDLPETKLDPNLVDINGKRIALSSLKGKYVLLTFWSARAEICLRENLQLKDLYKKYSKKGFEIYQINLDANESDWKTAVKFDELPWISVREDDPLDPKNAILYNVKSVPTNYLYDREGNIVASNIHDRALVIKLEQVFN